MRRGQAAMEFLMTYGWAILVVIAAIAALAYFGVLSPDGFLPDKCSAAPPFSCTQYKLSPDSVNISLSVNAGADVTPSVASLTCDGVNYADATTQSPAAGTLVTNGNEFSVVWTTFPAGCSAVITGNKFKASYNLTYAKAGETVSHTATGSIQGRVE